MTTSLARIAANQRNAQLSKGPTSVDGKARSRLNAFQHGRAGAGDLLAPSEDAALVAARTEAFAVEFQAVGVAGEFLARRAAVLSVRMDQARVDAEEALHLQVQAARDAFDTAWVGELDRLTDLLTRRLAMHGARVELEQTADGIVRLLEFWDRESAAITQLPGCPDRRQRLASLLALTAAETQEFTPAQYVDRINIERNRLQQVDAETRVERLAALARLRDAVGRAARLDPSRQVLQIRRYDAAAERGFYRAVRAIGDLRRAQVQSDQPDSAPVIPPAVLPRSMPTPAPSPGKPESTQSPPKPLGSFRLDIPVTASSLEPPLVGEQPTRSGAEPRPKKRRDVRQVKSRRR